MPDGFRVAKGYVEIETAYDQREVDAAARAAGERAGTVLGDEAVRKTQDRFRDSRGRFRKMGEDSGDESGAGASTSFVRRMLGGAAEGMGKITNKIIPDAFNSMPKQVALPLAAAIAGAGTIAMPMLGAATAGAIIGTAAGAGILGGLVVASKSPIVQAAWANLGEVGSATLGSSFGGFLEPVLAVIDQIEIRLRSSWGESLKGIGDNTAAFLRPLADSALYAIDRILPAIETATGKAGPIMDSLGNVIESFGNATADFFDSLDDNVGSQAIALEEIGKTLTGLIIITGEFLGWLSKMYGELLKLGNAFGLVSDETILYMNAANAAEGVTRSVGGAMVLAGENASEYRKRQALLNGSVEEGIKAAGSYAEMLDMLNGRALDAEETYDAWQAAIDEVTSSVKENGKSLDANTEKGRANRDALRRLAESAQNHAAAVYEETAATKGSKAAQEAATRAYNSGRESLVKAAQQLGMTRKQAEAYADKVMKIPKNWNTNVTASTSKAKGRLDEIIRIMRNIRSKTVTVTVVESILRQDDALARRANGRATGGFVWGRGGDETDANLVPISNGEFVVRAKAARKLGAAFMNVINNADRLGSGIPAKGLDGGISAGLKASAGSKAVYITVPFVIGGEVLAQQVIRVIDGAATVVSRSAFEGSRSRSWTSARASLGAA